MSRLQSGILFGVFLGEAPGLASLGNLPESVYCEGSVLCPSITLEFKVRETFCREEKMFSGSCPTSLKDFFFLLEVTEY